MFSIICFLVFGNIIIEIFTIQLLYFQTFFDAWLILLFLIYLFYDQKSSSPKSWSSILAFLSSMQIIFNCFKGICPEVVLKEFVRKNFTTTRNIYILNWNIIYALHNSNFTDQLINIMLFVHLKSNLNFTCLHKQIHNGTITLVYWVTSGECLPHMHVPLSYIPNTYYTT